MDALYCEGFMNCYIQNFIFFKKWMNPTKPQLFILGGYCYFELTSKEISPDVYMSTQNIFRTAGARGATCDYGADLFTEKLTE